MDCLDHVRYEESIGVLIWKYREVEHFASARSCASWNTKYAGTPTGSVNNWGYKRLRFMKRDYLCHRVIWTLVHGPIPSGSEIDHIDGNPLNNRIGNLRLASRGQNASNRCSHPGGTSGVRGVYKHTCGRWAAQIKHAGKVKYLGLFDKVEDARAAYVTAATKMRGEFTSVRL